MNSIKTSKVRIVILSLYMVVIGTFGCDLSDNDAGRVDKDEIILTTPDSNIKDVTQSPVDAIENQIISGADPKIFDAVNSYAKNLTDNSNSILEGLFADKSNDSSAVFQREIQGNVLRAELRFLGTDSAYSVFSLVTTTEEDFEMIRRSLVFLSKDYGFEFRFILATIDDIPYEYKLGSLIWLGYRSLSVVMDDCIDLPSGNTACKSYF